MESAGLPHSRMKHDLAAEAAAMLLRLGFSIFAIVIPSATLMSRWVIVVLVPIGCVLLILAAMMKGDPFQSAGRMLGRLSSIPGLAAFLLGIWAMTSLAWAPAPSIAAEKLFKTLGVVSLGFFAIMALPARMRATNLHLVTIGVAFGAVFVLLAAAGEAHLLGDYSFKVPTGTPGRAVILLSCLGWAGAAWLLIRDRRGLAIGLMALVFAAALTQPGGDAVLPIGVGFLAFSAAWVAPERTGFIIGVLAAAVVLFAPLLACVAEVATHSAGLPAEGIVARFGLWWRVFAADTVHLLTGRGFEAALHGRDVGFIPTGAPISLLPDLWFDLGLVGALALGIVVFAMFATAGRLGFEVAPLALAGLASAMMFALVDRGATQTWWLNGMVVFAVVLASVERGRYRTIRPRAVVGETAPAPTI